MKKVSINPILLLLIVILSTILSIKQCTNNQTWYKNVYRDPVEYFRYQDLVPVTDKQVLERLDQVPEEFLFPGVRILLDKPKKEII